MSNNRAARRKQAHETKIPVEPAAFRIKYDLSLPGGPLRSLYPARSAGVIEARDEADLLRNVVSMIIEQAYANTPREEFAKIFAGILCDVLNPAGQYVRALTSYGVQYGLGLSVQSVNQIMCPTCQRTATEGETLIEHAEVLDDDGVTIEKHTTPVNDPAVLIDIVRRYEPLQPPPEEGKDADTISVRDDARDESTEEANAGNATPAGAEPEAPVAESTRGIEDAETRSPSPGARRDHR